MAGEPEEYVVIKEEGLRDLEFAALKMAEGTRKRVGCTTSEEAVVAKFIDV